MAVVLKEQLELRPSVALQKKVGLKSLEQVIRWGDRVNQELRRWRKLEDKKCWRARAVNRWVLGLPTRCRSAWRSRRPRRRQNLV